MKKEENKYDNIVEAYKLSNELFRTLKESELFKNGYRNRRFAFDIMAALSHFTSEILGALCACVPNGKGDELYDFYVNELLPAAFKPTRELCEDISAHIPEDKQAS